MEIIYTITERCRCNKMHEIGIDISVVGNYEQFQKLYREGLSSRQDKTRSVDELR